MIYLHVPFCRSFCIYCDFYSEICPRGQVSEILSWSEAVLSEIEDRRTQILSTRAEGPDTLYIGGGTPSVLPVEVLQRIVAAIGGGPFGEFTLEANPDDIVRGGPEYVRQLTALRVNRISMGVQSFDDEILRWMGRRHNGADAACAVGILREAGVKNVSIDLIFGLSQLSLHDWEATVQRALDLHPEHISAYALSIEEGSALAELVASGRYSPAGEEQCREQYEVLCEMLSTAGYEHYEISNFALPGARAVHNSAYWSGASYVGLGPGAHSYDSKSSVRCWNAEMAKGTDGRVRWEKGEEHLSVEEQGEERVMLSLRTCDGMDEAELCSMCPKEKVEAALRGGTLVRCGSGRVRIPEKHFFISDEIIADLF